jgi:hypothetical protein
MRGIARRFRGEYNAERLSASAAFDNARELCGLFRLDERALRVQIRLPTQNRRLFRFQEELYQVVPSDDKTSSLVLE